MLHKPRSYLAFHFMDQIFKKWVIWVLGKRYMVYVFFLHGPFDWVALA